jgi:glycosyltransferase involved in cell wall biosynthesis
MRVVVITETYPPNMGYIVSMLPKYFARQGLEVHVLAIDLPPYHQLDEFKHGVPAFLKSQLFPAGSVTDVDGYKVHVQKYRWMLGYTFMIGLHAKLKEIDADVVYCVMAIGWSPILTMLSKVFLRFKLFTGSHTSAMMFPLARQAHIKPSALVRNFVTRWIPGRIVSLFTEICYCPTSDCGMVASRFFGVQERKVRLIHLGVDTDFFFPPSTPQDIAAREALRTRLGFSKHEVVCIYTGKMTVQKNAVLLAQAVERLRHEGFAFRALFIGDGVQRDEVQGYSSSVVLDLLPVSELGAYYRSADIAVWLTNESTSMLDAAACGLPIVVSDRIYQDHVTGNGLAYRLNDLDSLCDRLKQLSDPETRRDLGSRGARKMRDGFTWTLAAQKRIADFNRALGASALSSDR